MEKTIIISDYDGSYLYSIYVNNKIYTKKDLEESYNIPNLVLEINNTYQSDYRNLKKLLKKYNFDRIILCEDGFIEIIKKEKEKSEN